MTYFAHFAVFAGNVAAAAVVDRPALLDPAGLETVDFVQNFANPAGSDPAHTFRNSAACLETAGAGHMIPAVEAVVEAVVDTVVDSSGFDPGLGFACKIAVDFAAVALVSSAGSPGAKEEQSQGVVAWA